MKMIGLLTVVGLLISCSSQSEKDAASGKAPVSREQSSATPASGRGGRAPGVAATIAQTMSLRQASLGVGTVLPAEQVELKSQISGKVHRIFFHEGQRVASGALLLKLDDAELQASRAKAAARKDFLQTMHQRRLKQFESEALSQQDLESSASELAQAEADVRLLDAQIAKTEIRAPFAGVLGLRLVSPGAVLAANQSVTSLVQPLPARVEFFVHAEQVPFASVGASVQVHLSADHVVEAPVVATEGFLSSTTRNLRVRAQLPPDVNVVPGSAVDVAIPQELQQGFLLPADALSGDEQGPLVFVLRDGKAFSSPVVVGPRTSQAVLIRSGVNPGDTVLSIGAQNVRAGQVVNILEIRE